MRPRQSSLGICKTNTRQGSPETRFNEAEAIKPRNHDGAKKMRAAGDASMRPRQSSLGIKHTLEQGGGQSFNEAEAIKPRNLIIAVFPNHIPRWLQ